MTLSVLGSSSAGNAYILRTSAGETLLIECGVKKQQLLQSLDFDLQHLAGCLLSHEHGDHAREARWVTSRRVPLYCSRGTANALQLGDDPMLRILTSKRAVKIGSFSVLPFDVEHDAEEPLGFLIEHEEMGRLLFLTDSYLLKYRFPKVTHWLIECNYSEDLIKERLASGAIHPAQYHRTTRSHMSYGTCLRTLRANDLTTSRQILLIHLSAGNTNAERCRQSIEEATGLPTMIAAPDMTIEINKTPF